MFIKSLKLSFTESNSSLAKLKITKEYRSYNTRRLTNIQKGLFSVSPDLHSIMIGLVLGDLYIEKRSENARLKFKQGLVNKEYAYHLFKLFSGYSNMDVPKHYEFFDKRTDKIYTSIVFNTFSLPCFNHCHELFYVKETKTIPHNIGELLTPIGLAYWAMDDGCKQSSGFNLCTDSYTLSEINLLIKVLKENFDLNCTYHNKGEDQYRIYIKLDSMDKFRALVTPHFHSSMMYKL